MYALAILILGMELILFLRINPYTIHRGPFVACVCGFYLLFCALQYVFLIFLKNSTVTILSLLPGVLLIILINILYGPSVISYGILWAVILQILLNYMPYREQVFVYACFVLDVLAVGLRFIALALTGKYATDKALFICLVVLTFYSVHKLIFKNNSPFHFFILTAVVLIILPVKKTPIDWSAFEYIAEKVTMASEDALYNLDGIISSENYATGYSSLEVTGGKLTIISKPQLQLSISDYPYYTYVDPVSGEKMVVRKTIYLPGSKSTDTVWLRDYLSLLHANGVDQERAALFSKVAEMKVEYVYLNTVDEILPQGCLFYSSEELEGSETHKKGYTLDATYLDIDYGSPYLTELFENTGMIPKLSYDEASDYMQQLYGLTLQNILSRGDYAATLENATIENGTTENIETENAALENGVPLRKCRTEITVTSDDLDTTGTNSKQKALARELTAEATSDYEKCLAVESYLRQFPYSTNALGGYQSDSSLATASGMADIANRFLFETQEGYCVHYTAAMVTLLRLNHIPARAVMGYRYDFPYTVQKDYTVTSDCAHAWPEAYIENVGWVIFEPTGAYTSATIRSWRKTADGDTVLIVSNPAEEDETDGTNADIKDSLLHILTIVGVVIGSMAAILALIIIGTFLYRKLRYHFADNDARVKMDVEQIKKTLVKRGATDNSPTENALIKGSQIDDNHIINERGLLYDYLALAPQEERDKLKRAFDLYYRSIYGSPSKYRITDEESLFVQEVCREICTDKQ